MKIKLISSVIIYFVFAHGRAQEYKPAAIVDSVQIKKEAIQNAAYAEQMRLEKELKLQEKSLKAQQKAQDKINDEKRKLEKDQEKAESKQRKIDKEQRAAEREQNKLDSAKKLVEKRTKKLEDANKDLVQMQEKFAKQKEKGKLSPVEIGEFEVKITKQQLRIKEIELDIYDAQEKLNKLQQ